MVNIASVEVLVAGMAGMALMFVFTGLAMAAVGVTAQEVVTEVCLVLCVCVRMRGHCRRRLLGGARVWTGSGIGVWVTGGLVLWRGSRFDLCCGIGVWITGGLVLWLALGRCGRSSGIGQASWRGRSCLTIEGAWPS